MKIFNVGVLEIFFILLLAIIVLGPKKAVETAGDVGRWIKKLMKSQFWKDLVMTSREIQDLPKKIMDEAEIQRTIEELDRTSDTFSEILGDEIPEKVTLDGDDGLDAAADE